MLKPEVLYKIIILYLLEKCEVPLSASAISDFLVSYNYTDYFNVMSVVNNLLDNELIACTHTNNTTTYSITEKGVSVLSPMKNEINREIKGEVHSYLSANNIKHKNANNIFADYDKTSGGYLVHLKNIEDNSVITDISFTVGNENLAKTICTNWKNKTEEIYEMLLDLLS